MCGGGEGGGRGVRGGRCACFIGGLSWVEIYFGQVRAWWGEWSFLLGG